MFTQPKHPYSQLLIEAVPSLKERKPLKITEGITHDPRNPPPGCIFQLRCPFVMDVCRSVPPPMIETNPRQVVACHLYTEGANAAGTAGANVNGKGKINVSVADTDASGNS
jgi:oligopeptide/dipeptide ABC transporter ATP-binding protein